MKLIETQYVRRRFNRFLFVPTVWILIFAGVSGYATANETTEPLDGVFVEEAVVTSAKVGDTALLRFQIANYSTAPIFQETVMCNPTRRRLALDSSTSVGCGFLTGRQSPPKAPPA